MDNIRRFRTKSFLRLESLRSGANIALICVILVGTLAICRADESVRNKETVEQDQDQLLREQPNRQFFRVHLMSGNKATSNKKLFPKVKVARQQPNLPTPSSSSSSLDTISSKIKTDLPDHRAAGGATDSGSDEQIKATTTTNKGQQEKQSKQLKGTTTTISSATLKKLLNQTLLKSSSNSPDSIAGNNSGQKTSKNFKFVFIQRATAAPGKLYSTSLPTSTSQPPTSANEQSISDSSSSSSSSPSKSSLAASVSKQLATSLLNSAAGLVADLSSSPSLSSLASQIVAASAAANSIGDTISLKRINSTNTNSSASSSSSSDLSTAESVAETTNKREQQQVNNLSSNEFGSSSSEKKTPFVTNNKKATSSKSKPSKIYNLPVKFVANGQPNHVVVFHTLREHFATIKRLQAMSSSNGTGGIKSNNSSIRLTNKERKQQQQQQQQNKQRHKLKGANSRLIYLPLRYLSNAKPNKIFINSSNSSSSSKATHKSSSNS